MLSYSSVLPYDNFCHPAMGCKSLCLLFCRTARVQSFVSLCPPIQVITSVSSNRNLTDSLRPTGIFIERKIIWPRCRCRFGGSGQRLSQAGRSPTTGGRIIQLCGTPPVVFACKSADHVEYNYMAKYYEKGQQERKEQDNSKANFL